MQISNECYTRMVELVDEFSKSVCVMTPEMKTLLIEMLADEFGAELTEQIANAYEECLDDYD